MSTQSQPTARATISNEQMRQYDGQRIAFSEDGARVVAHANDLAELDKLIVAAGEDPERVGIDRVVLDDWSLGGAEAR